MRRYTVSVLAVLFLLSLLIHPGSSSAAPYYAGKVITIIVGYGPGGGYDRIARILAKHLPKYIPGNPSIIVQNMPGADSMITANYVYNIAKPDGLTIGAFNRGHVFAQLLKGEGVKFDLNKFAWIGSAAIESTVLVLRSDLPYKTIEDVAQAKSPIILGNTGPADSSGQFPLFQKEFLGYNFKSVTYPSGNDIMLAIERKEVDGRGMTYSSARVYIDRGLVRPLIRGRVSEPGIEKLPVDEDLAKNARAKTLMAMRSAPDRMGRPYVAPPGTPAATMKILTEAFAKVAKDPALKEDSAKNKMDVEYVPADEVKKVVQYLLNQPPDIVSEFSKYVKF
jgi:tripartite-type tricarboxylate transporter receptor subunit TctC